MKDKIIIDGVDVSKCEFLSTFNTCLNSILKPTCISNKNCFYKQKKESEKDGNRANKRRCD